MQVRVDDPREPGPISLTTAGLDQEIGVVRHERSSQRRRAIEQLGIREPSAAVLLRREEVHASPPERDRNRAVDMNVEEEADAHSFRPRARSFSRTGDGPAEFRASWYVAKSLWISASSSDSWSA